MKASLREKRQFPAKGGGACEVGFILNIVPTVTARPAAGRIYLRLGLLAVLLAASAWGLDPHKSLTQYSRSVWTQQLF